MMKLLSTVHSLITRDEFCTKRDLFYQDPQLFGNQRYVDNVIDTLTSMLKVPRWHLHIVATSKGVIAGSLVYIDGDGALIDCTKSQAGILIPNLVHKINIQSTDAKFVLIVEKDATFQHLLESKATDKLGPCIMITAKGYPDLNTRQLLKLILRKYPTMPFYALVDADPHGVAIYLTYKFGSLVHAHDSENLTLPTLQWLGVLPSDIDSLQLADHVTLDLSTRERAHIQDILHRKYMNSLHVEIRELSIMLEKNKKIEIQSLDMFGRSYLTDVYIPYRLSKMH